MHTIILFEYKYLMKLRWSALEGIMEAQATEL